jgi:hypothetical protein
MVTAAAQPAVVIGMEGGARVYHFVRVEFVPFIAVVIGTK